MGYEYFIGRRYMRTRQRQAFISLITFLSTAGVTVGVMALIVVIAVMSGFEHDLKARILGGQAHITLTRHGGPVKGYPQLSQKVTGTKGVVAATPFIQSQIMLRSAAGISGALLWGVDPASVGKVIQTLGKISLTDSKGQGTAGGANGASPGIVLGKELARNLGVLEGDTLYLISPRGMLSPIGHVPAMRQFKVTGFFQSGMYDYDGSFAFIHLNDAQRLLRMPGAVNGLQIRVEDIYAADTVAERLSRELGFPFWTRDWMQMNKNLFSALKLEKITMFVILTLIVLVAAFNIASTLIMMVMGKTKDIAILKAMGATDWSIGKIFVFKGMTIGLIGTLLGSGLGFVLCALLKRINIHELAGEIYYITTNLPVRLALNDVVIIVLAAILICFLATLYPARQASKLNPVEAIRYG